MEGEERGGIEHPQQRGKGEEFGEFADFTSKEGEEGEDFGAFFGFEGEGEAEAEKGVDAGIGGDAKGRGEGEGIDVELPFSCDGLGTTVTTVEEKVGVEQGLRDGTVDAEEVDGCEGWQLNGEVGKCKEEKEFTREAVAEEFGEFAGFTESENKTVDEKDRPQEVAAADCGAFGGSVEAKAKAISEEEQTKDDEGEEFGKGDEKKVVREKSQSNEAFADGFGEFGGFIESEEKAMSEEKQAEEHAALAGFGRVDEVKGMGEEQTGEYFGKADEEKVVREEEPPEEAFVDDFGKLGEFAEPENNAVRGEKPNEAVVADKGEKFGGFTESKGKAVQKENPDGTVVADEFGEFGGFTESKDKEAQEENPNGAVVADEFGEFGGFTESKDKAVREEELPKETVDEEFGEFGGFAEYEEGEGDGGGGDGAFGTFESRAPIGMGETPFAKEDDHLHASNGKQKKYLAEGDIGCQFSATCVNVIQSSLPKYGGNLEENCLQEFSSTLNALVGSTEYAKKAGSACIWHGLVKAATKMSEDDFTQPLSSATSNSSTLNSTNRLSVNDLLFDKDSRTASNSSLASAFAIKRMLNWDKSDIKELTRELLKLEYIEPVKSEEDQVPAFATQLGLLEPLKPGERSVYQADPSTAPSAQEDPLSFDSKAEESNIPSQLANERTAKKNINIRIMDLSYMLATTVVS
eukprot:Nk52_evm4s967 gene=Nk52_evmTU4s967